MRIENSFENCDNPIQPLLGATVSSIEYLKEEKEIFRLEREKAEMLEIEEFSQQHAPITVVFHKEWKSYVMVRNYTLLSDKAVSKPYSSRYECEKAAKEVIRKTHELANQYVTTGNSKSVSKTVAKEYAEYLQAVFASSKDLLKSCCEDLGRTEVYEKIQRMVMECEKSLRSVLEEELNDSRDYYQMYRLDYFYDMIDIDVTDCRVSEGGLFRAMEAVFADNMHYTYTGVWSAISELEKDLNENLTTFYRRAYAEYISYIGKMEALLDTLDKSFMKQRTKEKQESEIEKTIKNMIKQEKSNGG